MPTPRDAERLSRFDMSPAGPRPRDMVLVIALVVLAILETALRTDLSWPVATAAVTTLALAALPWRRSHPLLVVATTTALSAGFEVAQVLGGIPTGGLVAMFALLMAPYALFRWGSTKERTIGGAILAAGLLCSLALSGTNLFTPEGIAGVVAGVAFVGGAVLIGALRRERVASRARDFAAIRAQEREALARDLHDTVAHHASAIVIRAQVASMAVTNLPADDIVRDSLEVIEREASAVMNDMRALVGVLRGPVEYAPSPGIAEIEDFAADGPPKVVVTVELPAAVPDIVATTLFRIAQEAITNARRHATGATSIRVAVTSAPGSTHLTVTDDGRSAASPSGDGHGLRGMSERAALLGGTVEAGPAPDGGWMLRAVIPTRSVR
ncbi:sensor histidine kinase [Microbacterium abyssi]|uniref:sensor histidine kinase n=1 Tax=Microbacterium abyssi TaxID=2782166 RepID=UPI001887DA1B|nr:histidine kinase [Microbacterium sp. A18JL241]